MARSASWVTTLSIASAASPVESFISTEGCSALAQLVAAYQRFNLPTTLRELEVDIHNREELDKVIAHTLRPVESIHYLPVELTPEILRAAFEKVESFNR
jgi:glycerol dehydrogenase-like iron-containing ADH family enzyme